MNEKIKELYNRAFSEYFGEECFKMTTWIGAVVLICIFVFIPYSFMVNHVR